MRQHRSKWKARAILVISLSLVFFCNGCAAVEYVQTGAQAQSAYDEGVALYDAKDYARAIPLFEQALKLQPGHDNALASLAWSYYHLGNYPESTRLFLQALTRQPGWVGLHDGLGWSRYRAGNYKQALESFRQALAIDRGFRDAGVGYAFSLFELGRYAEAMPQLERLVREGEPSSWRSAPPDHEDVRSRYAWVLFYLGDYTRSKEQFIKGTKARPEWSGLFNGLGWSCLRLGDKAQARQAFARALELDPGLADAKAGLAQSQQ